MAQTYKADPVATSIRFMVDLDAVPVGWWNSFDGLGMETALETREEGGNNLWVHQLPTRLKYTNVKLKRPINSESWKVAMWFMKIAEEAKRDRTAAISAIDNEGKVIAAWNLRGVVPVRWTGPSFDAESPKMVTETLELAYHGFDSPVAKGAF